MCHLGPWEFAGIAEQKETARIAAGRIVAWLPDLGSNQGPAD